MKRFKSLSPKQKRIFAISSVVAVLTIGATIAYHQDAMFFNNLFHLDSDLVEFTETFNSPDDWTPCTETPKTAIATNKNDFPRYVRMKINEYWRKKDSQTDPNNHETTDLPLTWEDNDGTHNYAIINKQNENKWTYNNNDGYYYYKDALNKDESTLSLLKSVTFNCEVNVSGEIRYSIDGKAGESVPTEYAGATYHLYITFQMSREDFRPQQHTANCNNATELYDIIACRTNGPDTGVDFTREAQSAGLNGWGVNTLSAHMNDEYPVYYFRGNGALNNNVLWAGKCWKAIRTTGTGGVKMSYAGYPTSTENGYVCDDEPYNTYSKASPVYPNGIQWYYSPGHVPSLGIVSYSFNIMHNVSESSNESNYSEADDVLYYGNDIEWVDGQYHLIDTIHGTWHDARELSGTRYHYFCFDGSDTCGNNRAGYIIDYSTDNDIFFYRLSDGKKIEDIKNDMLNGGNNPSVAKGVLEGWFSSISAWADEVEDTIYCNDKQIISGPIKDKDTPWDGTIAKFAAYERLKELGADGNYHPSVDCAQKSDSYTVNETTKGNGFLSKPVGMMSADELMLTGLNWDSGHNQWFAGRQEWSMTPAWYGYRFDGPSIIDWSNYFALRGVNGTYAYQIRPVISLKAGIEVVSGDGDALTPYKIKE